MDFRFQDVCTIDSACGSTPHTVEGQWSLADKKLLRKLTGLSPEVEAVFLFLFPKHFYTHMRTHTEDFTMNRERERERAAERWQETEG